jgi:hypothetical protein
MIYTRYVSCSNLGQDTESEASLFLVPQDKTGIIPKLGQYLNIVHNFRVTQLSKSPAKYIYSSLFTILYIIIASYMFRPYMDHHQGETQLQETHMTLMCPHKMQHVHI